MDFELQLSYGEARTHLGTATATSLAKGEESQSNARSFAAPAAVLIVNTEEGNRVTLMLDRWGPTKLMNLHLPSRLLMCAPPKQAAYGKASSSKCKVIRGARLTVSAKK